MPVQKLRKRKTTQSLVLSVYAFDHSLISVSVTIYSPLHLLPYRCKLRFNTESLGGDVMDITASDC